MTRKPGLSALVRLRDEEAWCRLALESIADWCDEIVIVLNRCSDRTPEIVEAFRQRHPDRTVVARYDHEIWPMGPGHDAIPATDPRSSAALYNFTLALATRSHATKWDGDMVAMDWLGSEVRAAMAAGHDRITWHGVDIVGDDLRHVGASPPAWRSPKEGVFRITSAVRWAQGALTQSAQGVPTPTRIIERPGFLHFKWARKSLAAATAQWPVNWREIPHFQRIVARRHPVAPYEGEYPAAVQTLLESEVA